MSEIPDRPLRIVHAVRAPVGGIFRHILDLANGQIDAGHHVGIVADNLTGGDRASAALVPEPQHVLEKDRADNVFRLFFPDRQPRMLALHHR